MLKYHNTEDIEGKVSRSILNLYKMDYKNFTLSSIVAGFHRVFGYRDEGIAMSVEIVNSIDDDTENLWERNLLTWNLYMLSREFIEDKMYEKAMEFLNRLDANWKRDVIIGDEIGVYHVSWYEQILLRKCEIYLLTDCTEEFEKITDQILINRFEFFEKAEKVTGETILFDRCTYSCLELMAYEQRKKDINKGLSLIKQAIKHKCGFNYVANIEYIHALENEKKGFYYRAFDLFLKCYYNLSDTPFDNIRYGYCSTCKNFDGYDLCCKFKIQTDYYKACSCYEV